MASYQVFGWILLPTIIRFLSNNATSVIQETHNFAALTPECNKLPCLAFQIILRGYVTQNDLIS